MKPFKNYIAEVFDKPLPYKITSNKHDWKKYEFSISRMLVKVAIIDYDGIGNYEVDFKVDGLHALTGMVGSADSLKIFTTVVAIILDFVKAVQPNKIEFSAAKSVVSGDSRSKLYDKMIKRLTPKGYVYAIRKLDDTTYYTLTKKKK